MTEDCRRLLIDFLLRYPDASNESAISEVLRWLVGRVVIELRDEREAAAVLATPRTGGEDGDQSYLKEEATQILEQDPPRDW